MRLLLFVIYYLSLAQTCFAEYRVFLLRITNPTGEVQLRPSTLDPLQYKTYFPTPDGAIVTYDDTWMCRGRTDNLPLCESPRAAVREPAEAVIPPTN